MRLQSIANTSSFQLSSITRNDSVGKKMLLPVDGNLLLYSRFRHVHGTPAIKDGEALPLCSLRAMDNLIDRLIAVRGRSTYLTSVESMDRIQIEFTVDTLQKELNGLVSGANLPLTAGSEQNDVGLILNLIA